MSHSLYSPVSLGSIDLSNRVVMAPMTRGRAGPGDVPTALMVDYYRQRASAGMIITEGVQPTAEGKGYWRTPGIHSDEQVEGWRAVADAVHARGGRIVMQLMHCGRVVVPDNRGFEARVIAPSALPCPDLVPGPDGVPAPTAMPDAIAIEEIPVLLEEYAQAARNAIAAGLDGVELHCASGYLINQFLNVASNHREDAYGGSVENRIRFPLEVLKAMADAIGGDRVGFRISPGNPYNGMDITDPIATFGPFVKAANELGLAYIHAIDLGIADLSIPELLSDWTGPVIINNNLKAASAQVLLEEGRAHAVSFGRPFIANPDLVERFRAGAPLARIDFEHLYVGEEIGYTSYPEMEPLAPAAAQGE